MLAIPLVVLLFIKVVSAHQGAFAKGMYCLNGPQLEEEQNSNAVTMPIYNKTFEKWWGRRFDGCHDYPPAPGDILNLPAGGYVKLEIATNRGKTELSFDGKYTSEWTDGAEHPEDFGLDGKTCIGEPNIHVESWEKAAGTGLAISYHSRLDDTTPENMVVFSILEHTPWKRVAMYEVPAGLPNCPEDGCHCSWGWVAEGCGEPNMYVQYFRCNVTGSTSTKKLAKAQPLVWCEDDESKCVKGAKQMVYWQQQSGNNIKVPEGVDPKTGKFYSPGYNAKVGFNITGAQHDIFEPDSDSPTSSIEQNMPTSTPGTPTSSISPPSSTLSNNVPTSTPGTPTSSISPPSSTLSNNGTTPTPTDRPRTQCPRSNSSGVKVVKKSSIVGGVESHRKRNHARHLL